MTRNQTLQHLLGLERALAVYRATTERSDYSITSPLEAARNQLHGDIEHWLKPPSARKRRKAK